MLSTVVHGRTREAEEVGRTAIMAVRHLDDERAALYSDVIVASVHAVARAILEDLMGNGTYQYQSDFAKRYVRALALLRVLTARGVEVTLAVRDKVMACGDEAILDRWIARAATARETSEAVEE